MPQSKIAHGRADAKTGRSSRVEACSTSSPTRHGARRGRRSDDTAAIQRAMDAAAERRRRRRLSPAGEYAVRGHLRGALGRGAAGDLRHFPPLRSARGQRLRIYAGRERRVGGPAIVMQRKSGIRGLTFLYPRQRYDRIVPFPYTIQGRGEDIYVVNIMAINSYKILDFMTCRCDRHYLDRVFGAPLRVGIAVGGRLRRRRGPQHQSESRLVDALAVSRLPGHARYSTRRSTAILKKNPVVKYVIENLDAMVYGDCTDELEFAAAICPRTLWHAFRDPERPGRRGRVSRPCQRFGRSDRAVRGARARGRRFHQHQPGQLQSGEKRYCGDDIRSEARFYNVATWGMPDYSAVVKSGSLLFELAHFNQYAPFVVNGGRLALTNVLLSRTFLGRQGTAGQERRAGRAHRQHHRARHAVECRRPGRSRNRPASRPNTRFPPGQPARNPSALGCSTRARARLPPTAPERGIRARSRTPNGSTGAWGTALAFDGKGNSQLAINTRGMPEFKAMTVEAWVCPGASLARCRGWSRGSIGFRYGSTSSGRGTILPASCRWPTARWNRVPAVRSRRSMSGSTSRRFGTATICSFG